VVTSVLVAPVMGRPEFAAAGLIRDRMTTALAHRFDDYDWSATMLASSRVTSRNHMASDHTTPPAGRALLVDVQSIPLRRAADGLTLKVVTGESVQIRESRTAPVIGLPEDAHPNEQLTYVLSGMLRATGDQHP
jgi:hypothetical protein